MSQKKIIENKHIYHNNIIKEKCFICWWKYSYFMTWEDFDKHTTLKKFDIYKCISCWVEKIFPEPTYEEITSFYPQDYYSFHIENKNRKWFNTVFEKLLYKIYHNKQKIIKYFLQRWKMWIPYKRYGKWYFLDIGCGDGYMVNLLEKLWWQSYGFEIWETKKIGNIIYAVDITKADFWGAKFDFIRIAHVFEHIINPIQFLKKIKSLLQPNWVVEFTLPNTKSFDAKIFWKYRSNRDTPRHLINYNINNLELLFKNQWFIILKKRFMLWFGLSWSLRCLLRYKYKRNIKRLNIKIIIYILLWLDFILSLLHIWDHMWFRIKLK